MTHNRSTESVPASSHQTIGVNALGAHFGGVVRVLEQFVATSSRHHQVRVWQAPPHAKFPTNVEIESTQGATRLRTFAGALLRVLSKPSHVDVRVDIAQGFLLKVQARRRVLIVHDLVFLDSSNTHVRWRQRVYRWLIMRWGLWHSDRVVAVSEKTADEVRAFVPAHTNKIIVAPLPVDNIIEALSRGGLARQPLERAGRKTVLAFGHARNKGVETLVGLLRMRPEFDLRIVCAIGTWQTFGFADLVQTSGIADRVNVLSNISDVDLVKEYCRADVFCMPSSYEGYGLPVAEALACACPTVISDLDVLAATSRGFAVRCEGWGPKALSAACDRALAHPPAHWQQASLAFRYWTWQDWSDCVLGGSSSPDRLS